MIDGLIGWLAGRRWALTAAKWGAVGLTVLLFLLSVLRAGERAGRLVERLETVERPMTCNARCSMRRLAGLVVAASWLGGCATAGSELPIVAVCPPVVEYSTEFRAWAAEELELLPEGAAIVGMLGDYAVMRDQARGCAR